MPQLFPKASNTIARTLVLGLPLVLGTLGVGGAAFFRSDYTTGAREVVEQPVPFSHKHHVAQLGIDCRYCHTSVEKSASAGFPPTKTCMNCHQQMWTAADLLEPVRTSYAKGTPITWAKVHNVPDYTYFNHSIHVAKGVGCASCHGPIDDMNLVYQAKTLLMEWCLDCHRHPENHLRPKDQVFNIGWKPSDQGVNPDTGKPYTQLEIGKALKAENLVRGPEVLTNCSICHR
jgi:hypothetical protein